MLECTSISVNGLSLISSTYYFTLDGIFNNGKDVIINDLYSDGQSFNRSKTQVKQLLLNGYVKTMNVNDFMYLRQILCTNALKTFTVTIPYFETLTFQAEITNWGMGALGSFTIACQLEQPDPYLYTLTPQILSLGALSNASLTFPLTFPLTFGTMTGASGTIVNSGNTNAFPLVTIIGGCTPQSITNVTTGVSMSFNPITLNDGDIMTIDMNPSTCGITLYTISTLTIANRMDLKIGNWISCLPGNNIFSFARNSLETIQHCTVTLLSRYI
jgi:hypothetical protein